MHLLIADKEPVTTTLLTNVLVTLVPFQQQFINWDTAPTPCTALQSKDPALSIWNLKSQPICVEDQPFLFMDANAVQLVIPQTLHLQDVRQDVLF